MPKRNLPDAAANREIVITRVFDAPRELVFRAWTDPNHLAQWWGPGGFTNPVCDWDVRPGGKIYDVMRGPNGVDYPMGGEFREIVAPERLVLSCGALDEKGELLFEFLHAVTFIERRGRTTVTIRSRVTMTTAAAAKYIGGYKAGMTQSLERLADHLAQKTEPFVIERTFKAPVEKVWKALTTRAAIKQWAFDMKGFKPLTGTEFEFYAEKDGVKYVHRCKVMEVMTEKRLAYTWRYEGYAGDSLVSLDLYAEGNKTRVRLTHTGLESFPPNPVFARENFMKGWTYLVGTSLKKLVETRKKS